MPGLTGRALAELVAEYVPGPPTLFISGYTAAVICDRGQPPAGSAYLESRSRPTLLEAVGTLLDAPRAWYRLRSSAAGAGKRSMRLRGFEPPRAIAHRHLKTARLPGSATAA